MQHYLHVQYQIKNCIEFLPYMEIKTCTAEAVVMSCAQPLKYRVIVEQAWVSAYATFLFQVFYDQQDYSSCQKASQKTAQRKSVQQQKCHFCYSFFLVQQQ